MTFFPDGRKSLSRRQPYRRIVVHDYAGHPFQIQLSRWLAARGHEVLHLYSGDVETPRGQLQRTAEDAPGFAVEAVSLGRPFDKYALVRRWFQEREFGKRLTRRTLEFAPDIVLSANAPPAVQSCLSSGLGRHGIPLVCWVQDLFTPGVAEALRGKPALLRWAIGRALERIEFGTMRKAAGLIAISDDFVPVLAGYGVRHPRTAVVENWAPLGDLRPMPKDNGWARAHGLADRFVFLYAGTLGKKHDPAPLAALARAFRDDPLVRVVVISQGPGRQWLEAEKQAGGLDSLILMDYQPFDELPEVLATGDVGVVLLERFAGVLSVPSKVTSHLCAGRPILASIPQENLARRRVEDISAGLCSDPGDEVGFIAAARRLREDGDLRAACAARQADYVAVAFDIDRIGARFEDFLQSVLVAEGHGGTALLSPEESVQVTGGQVGHRGEEKVRTRETATLDLP